MLYLVPIVILLKKKNICFVFMFLLMLHKVVFNIELCSLKIGFIKNKTNTLCICIKPGLTFLDLYY